MNLKVLGLSAEWEGVAGMARRQPEIRMAGARVAVDATMLAALVRIDRLGERDVGRIVAADDGARLGKRHFGVRTAHFVLFASLAVVESLALLALEAALRIVRSATPLERERDGARHAILRLHITFFWRNSAIAVAS